MKAFDPKLPAGQEIFAFDFVKALSTGETITSASWAVTVLSGTDAAASTMASGPVTIAGSKVSQLIINGVSGVRYLIECIATTSLTQRIPAYASLYVTDPS